jgi:hypothetical protein
VEGKGKIRLRDSEREKPAAYSRQPTVKEEGFGLRASGFGMKRFKGSKIQGYWK